MFTDFVRWVNTKYLDIAAPVVAAFLIYFLVLWGASIFDAKWLATIAMWFAFFAITIAYWSFPGLVAGTIEWINWRDDAERWTTLNAYLMLCIVAFMMGSLAIIMGMISGGKLYPFTLLAIIIGIYCLISGGKSNLSEAMKRLAVFSFGLGVVVTIASLPYGKWVNSVYEKTGYSVKSYNQADVAGRKALNENAELADHGAAQCIEKWKRKNMSRSQVVTEEALRKATEQCKKVFGLGASSHPTDPQSRSQDGLWGQLSKYWDDYMSLKQANFALWLAILIALHLPLIWLWKLWKWWKNRNSDTTTTSTSSKKEDKKSGDITFWKNLVLVSILAGGGYYAYQSDVVQEFLHSEPKAAMLAQQAPDDPKQVFNAKNIGRFRAMLNKPASWGHEGGAYEMAYAQSNGKRPVPIVGMNGGYTNPFLVLDPENESHDLIIKNPPCAKRVADSNHTEYFECNSSWEMRDESAGGSARIISGGGAMLLQLIDGRGIAMVFSIQTAY